MASVNETSAGTSIAPSLAEAERLLAAARRNGDRAGQVSASLIWGCWCSTRDRFRGGKAARNHFRGEARRNVNRLDVHLALRGNLLHQFKDPIALPAAGGQPFSWSIYGIRCWQAAG